MRILRQRRAERLEDVDLARGVVDVVVAADDVGDLHVPVVHHDAEIVGGRAVRTGDDEVVQLAVVDHDAALDQVVDHHRAVERRLETHHRRNAGRRRGLGIAPAPVVAGLLAARGLLLAHGFQFFLAGVAVVSLAFLEQLLEHFAVAIHALHLVERAFVVVQPEPRHGVQNDLGVFRRGALQVGILDAQYEGALVAPGEGPGKQRGAGAAEVQVAGGAGSETGTDHGHGVLGEKAAFYAMTGKAAMAGLCA